MSNTELFKKEIQTLMESAVGVILVKTKEPLRACNELFELCYGTGYKFECWNHNTGWQKFKTIETSSPIINYHSEPSSSTNSLASLDGDILCDEHSIDFTTPDSCDDIKDIIPAMEKVYNLFTKKEDNRIDHNNEKQCFIMIDTSLYFNMPRVIQYLRDQVDHAIEYRKRLIIIEHETCEIPAMLEDFIHVVDFKPPSYDELLPVWSDIINAMHPAGALKHFTASDTDTIIKNSLGMTYLQFDKAIGIASTVLKTSLATKNKKPIDKLQIADYKNVTPAYFINYIIETKTEIIKKTHILELLPSVSIDNVGGLDSLKEWMFLRKHAYSDKAKAFGVDQPKGILLVGIPGAGKSLAAKSIASVLGIPCIKFDVGKVFGQYIGQSENQMRAALKQVEAMAPVVLLIDEVEKAFGGIGSGGDSGTSSRVFGSMLTWLQERNNSNTPVFVVMTANKVTGLPPELMRKGRIDEIFCVDFPNYQERLDILKIHVEKRGHKLSDADYTILAKHTDRFVGAEIETIVASGVLHSFAKNKNKLDANDILDQAKLLVPLSTSFAEQIAAMSEWSKTNAIPASKPYNKAISDSDTASRPLNNGRVVKRPIGRGTR